MGLRRKQYAVLQCSSTCISCCYKITTPIMHYVTGMVNWEAAGRRLLQYTVWILSIHFPHKLLRKGQDNSFQVQWINGKCRIFHHCMCLLQSASMYTLTCILYTFLLWEDHLYKILFLLTIGWSFQRGFTVLRKRCIDIYWIAWDLTQVF